MLAHFGAFSLTFQFCGRRFSEVGQTKGIIHHVLECLRQILQQKCGRLEESKRTQVPWVGILLKSSFLAIFSTVRSLQNVYHTRAIWQTTQRLNWSVQQGMCGPAIPSGVAYV